jgi:hypothetical protein
MRLNGWKTRAVIDFYANDLTEQRGPTPKRG